jgi:hypothetical protein
MGPGKQVSVFVFGATRLRTVQRDRSRQASQYKLLSSLHSLKELGLGRAIGAWDANFIPTVFANSHVWTLMLNRPFAVRDPPWQSDCFD